MKPAKAIPVLAGALVALGMVGWSTPGLAEDAPAKGAPAKLVIDVNDCLSCHEDTVKAFETTHHAGLENSCQSCHGDVSKHLTSVLETGEPGPVVSIKRLKPEESTRLCLTCHDKDERAHFEGGVHDRRGVACISCHSVHSFKSSHSQLKEATESETCFQCHKQIRAKTMRQSHHPVREGKLDCGSCHDPHDGTKPKMIRANWTNELCLTCHTEKRGPFLWEHAPVREDCTLCHDPHGSNHERLLVARQPFLCQRCHLNTRHPGTLYDGTNASTGINPSNRAVEHACKNCHQNVHGGNAPSGPYLGR
jgi:DmsE family decaheme c-type cytochrome